MITHSQAITAWEEVFQPTEKRAIRLPIPHGAYTEYVNEPIRSFTLDSFPFMQTIYSSRSRIPVVEHMAALYVYFKTLKEGTQKDYRAAQRIWLNIYPHIPERYRKHKEYKLLLEYFSYKLPYTPIDIKTGKALRQV